MQITFKRAAKTARGRSYRRRRRRMLVELLEPRIALSASGGLVPVGTQPVGALSGKIIYTQGGHGWTADNLAAGAWAAQRPETFELIEDLGNQDQMNFFADELFRAGATVVPLRPIGHQPNEVVLDNDDVQVSFVGAWSDSGSSIYFGDVGDVPYRFASTSPTETAYARYRPNVSEAGFYPVYTWVRYGSDRASDQLYRIRHTGGTTEVTVNHRQVGNGVVYLGTYYFDAGTEGYVDVSNRSGEAGRVVIADMIRFGNGMGDIDRGGGVSGLTREDESGLYWVKWHVDRSQGIPDSEYRTSASDRTASVSFSPRYAEYMNREADGSLVDRVYVGFHSNAGGGAARGVLALLNGNNTPSSATPNQLLLANTLGTEVNDDLVAQNGLFEHDWADRATVTLDRTDFEFGEINNLHIQNEFDATIIETGFHDNQLDAEMIRDPRVRQALARATYQGVVRFFNAVDGQTPVVMTPPPVTNVRAESVATGIVQISWQTPIASEFAGDAATSYRVYTSRDGRGFDGGTLVTGGSTDTRLLTGLDSDATYYFKIVAVNAGGESVGSEVVAALPGDGDSNVLIVNGFDRYDRSLNPRVSYGGAVVDRVRPLFSNSFDYAVQTAAAIESVNPSLRVDTVANELVIDGTISLDDYDSVVWILGEESSVDSTFDATEQTLVSSYLAGGGNLFASGSEIGRDLDQLGNGASFYNNVLRADFVANDSNTNDVQGTFGSIFDGLALSFDDGSLFYDVTFPDVLSPTAGAETVLQYIGGTGGTAGIQFDPGTGGGKVVLFGFPFETITTESIRSMTMSRILEFFGQQLPGDYDGDGDLDCDDVLALTLGVIVGSQEFDANGDGTVDAADIQFWVTDLRGTLLGDANLDDVVDGADFDIWNARRFTNGGYFCTGDFNGDFAIDLSDLHIFNENKTLPPPPSLNPLPDRFDAPTVAREIEPVALSANIAGRQVPDPIIPLRKIDRTIRFSSPSRVQKLVSDSNENEDWQPFGFNRS